MTVGQSPTEYQQQPPVQPSSQEPAPEPKRKNKPLIAMVLAIVALVCLGLTWAGPLYKTESSKESENSFGDLSTKETVIEKATYDYDGVEISYERSHCRSDETTCDEEQESRLYDYGDTDSSGPGSGSITYFQETGRVFEVFEYINIISLILIIVVIVMAPVSLFVSMDPKVPAAIALIAFILALLAPVYMATALPSAIEKDVEAMDIKEDYCPADPSPCTLFVGLNTYNDPPEGTVASVGFEGKMTWGPDLAWTMSIVAMVLMLVATILLFRSPRMVSKPG